MSECHWILHNGKVVTQGGVYRHVDILREELEPEMNKLCLEYTDGQEDSFGDVDLHEVAYHNCWVRVCDEGNHYLSFQGGRHQVMNSERVKRAIMRLIRQTEPQWVYWNDVPYPDDHRYDPEGDETDSKFEWPVDRAHFIAFINGR